MKAFDKCPICGSEWRGGSCLPGKEMPRKLRVNYDCGLSVSINDDGWPERKGNLYILMKGCKELKHETEIL